MVFALYKGGIKNKTKATEIDITDAVKLIRSGIYSEDIERLRKTDNPSTAKVIKSNLDYFTFSGTFKERSVDGLIKHSGLICIDFDDVQDVEKTKYLFSLIPFVHLLFTSPRGNGLKMIVKINPEKHLESFLQIEQYFLKTYEIQIDKSGKDVSRACFVSSDPHLFYNSDSFNLSEFHGVREFTISATPEPQPEKKIIKEYVDEETGEVITITGEEGWDRKNKEDFERLKTIVSRVVEAKIDITGQYDDWLTIGLSLATFGELARELYHQVSQFHPDYNERACNNKFDNCLKTGKFKTPGRFYSICKEYGIDIKQVKKLKLGYAEGTSGDELEWQYYDNRNRTYLSDLTEEQIKDIHHYRIAEIDNKYYYASKFEYDNKIVEGFFVSNFVIKPLFLVLSKTDPKRIIEISNIYGVKKVIDIPTKSFVSLSEFNAFVESQGNFLFIDKPPFTLIKVKIYEKTLNAEEIKTLGWHRDGIYFFANGGFNSRFMPVDEYGIVKHEYETEETTEGLATKNYFIPAVSSIYKDSDESFESEKKFIYVKRKDVTFESWSIAFHQVHGANGMIAICYYLTALFRDIIYSKFKFFPHLFLFGPPGTGKSTVAWSMQYMFGLAQGPFMLNAGTPPGFFRTFAQFRNALPWFDEYSNDIDPKRIQSLKGAYDGSGHIKAEYNSGGQSNKTITTPINSACVISGQQLPIADIALFKRVILLQYSKTEHTDEEKKALSNLQEIEQKGLSHITGAMMVFRDKIEKEFSSMFEETLKEFTTILGNTIETRILLNTVIPVTMYRLTADKLKFPFTYENLKAFAIKNVKEQNNLISSAKETSIFWDMMDFMLAKHMIKSPDDFKIETKSEIRVTVSNTDTHKKFESAKQLLFIRLASIHPQYMELHRKQHNKNGMDKNSIIHYLTNQKNYIGSVHNMKFGKISSSAFIFDYDMLKNDGYDFERVEEFDAMPI